MALLDRLKLRIQTDLLDEELTAILGEAQMAIRLRYGPDRDEAVPLVITKPGFKRLLKLNRPVDILKTVTVTEHYTDALSAEEWSEWSWTSGDAPTVLATSDYRVWHGGRTLERISGGTNSRSLWGPWVQVSYIPVDDQALRDEAAIKLSILNIQYQGLSSQKVGDVDQSFDAYDREREHVLRSLAPSKMVMA